MSGGSTSYDDVDNTHTSVKSLQFVSAALLVLPVRVDSPSLSTTFTKVLVRVILNLVKIPCRNFVPYLKRPDGHDDDDGGR